MMNFGTLPQYVATNNRKNQIEAVIFGGQGKRFHTTVNEIITYF